MFATPADAATHLQDRLSTLNHQRFTPTTPSPSDAQAEALQDELRWRREEIAYVERERAAVHAQALAAPRAPEAFAAWFKDLQDSGPGQGDALFPWLAEYANRAAVRWFLTQEMAGEAGFDDLVALTQLRLPAGVKLELARNFWDEMGQGKQSAMHGPLFDELAEALELPSTRQVLPEALAVGNLCSALAANRGYCYLSLGALGAVELTAPGRCEHVNAALKRLGVPGSARRYYAVHATLDVKHADSWLAHVLLPLVATDADLVPHIAAGALMRLRAGARSYVRYREILWENGC